MKGKRLFGSTLSSFILPPSSFDLLRPSPRLGDDERGEAAEARRVGRFERAPELGQAFAAHEADGRAAEAAARHARAEHALDAPRRLREHVQLGAANFVVVPQRLVRETHQPSDLFQISAAEGVGRGERARVLCDDVAAAPAYDFGKLRGVSLELFDAHVAKLLDGGEEAPK